MYVYNLGDKWSKVTDVVLWVFALAFGLLFSLDLAIAFKSQLALPWTSFAMLMGSVLWFIAVSSLIGEWKKFGRLFQRPKLFLGIQIVCAFLLVISVLGLFYEWLQGIAMGIDIVASLFNFVIFVLVALDKPTVNEIPTQ